MTNILIMYRMIMTLFSDVKPFQKQLKTIYRTNKE